MRWIPLLLFAALTGCATAPTTSSPADYGPEPDAQAARQAILQYLRKTLKDPDSLKDLVIASPRRECYPRGLINGGGNVCAHKVCASYNAKNSYGAYAGTAVLVFWFRGNTAAGGVFENAGACPGYIDPALDWKPAVATPAAPAAAPAGAGQDCTDDARNKLKERGLTPEAIAEICGGA